MRQVLLTNCTYFGYTKCHVGRDVTQLQVANVGFIGYLGPQWGGGTACNPSQMPWFACRTPWLGTVLAH